MSFCPLLELTNAPGGPSDIGQLAQTDSYVLIMCCLEPSPNAEAASSYTRVPDRLEVRSGEECVGPRLGNPHVRFAVLRPRRDARPPGNHLLGSSFDIHCKCTKSRGFIFLFSFSFFLSFFFFLHAAATAS